LAELPASFDGVLPCADCEGIRHQLDLFSDGSFFYRLTFLGRDAAFDDIGTFSVDDESGTLTLQGGREAPVAFRIAGVSTLRKLDLEGHEIESTLNHDLKRMDGFHPIEPRLMMRGMYSSMADAAAFEECLTGRRFPVATEADNAALEAAYREAPHDPGVPMLVSLEGRIAARPAMEGDATVLSVVPERFIGTWPGEACAARPVASEVENTYWKLTRLGDEAVVIGGGRREPFLVLSSIDRRLAAFNGCNRVTGSYRVTGQSIWFGQLASTMMACVDGMEYEKPFAEALERARTWRITGERLELRDRDGALLARFEAGPMP
jgi:copper homeostasis protein (lipoprotein)